eukprot:5222325-Prymnesium_polylepis.1
MRSAAARTAAASCGSVRTACSAHAGASRCGRASCGGGARETRASRERRGTGTEAERQQKRGSPRAEGRGPRARERLDALPGAGARTSATRGGGARLQKPVDGARQPHLRVGCGALSKQPSGLLECGTQHDHERGRAIARAAHVRADRIEHPASHRVRAHERREDGGAAAGEQHLVGRGDEQLIARLRAVRGAHRRRERVEDGSAARERGGRRSDRE